MSPACSVRLPFLLRHALRAVLLTALPLQALHAEIRLRDDTGQEIRLPAPARRIVSLAPHITETLFAAGAGAAVAGAVEYSDYPAAARQIPRVGGYSRIDPEAIAALRPDLVIAWQTGNAPAQIDRLRALGLPVFVSQPNRIADVARSLEQFGTLAGTGSTAGKAASTFRQRLGALQQQYGNRPPVRVFYQVWKQPLTTIGGPQIISDVIHLCGGYNIFGHLSQMAPTVSLEAVLAANPDVIVASGMGEPRPEWLDDWRKWTSLTAVRRNHLYHINPDIMQRHTPRILDGASQLCTQLEQVRARR